MRYTFIIYKTEHPRTGDPKEIDMVLIENYSDVYSVVQKIIGPNAVKTALNPHSFNECKRLPGDIIIPSSVQELFNPVTLGNKVFFNLAEGIGKKHKFIMNYKGGYQRLLDDMSSIGWIEVRREQREKLTFTTTDKYGN